MSYYISEPVKNLINSFSYQEEVSKDVSKIKVDHFVSKMAFFYEKLRNVVDYKDKHLLRRSAVERILRRRITVDKNKSKIAENVIKELIWAKYLENDKLPETKILQVQSIINKYLNLINSTQYTKRRDKKKFIEWVMGVASCEVEDALTSLRSVGAIVETMFQIMDSRLKIKDVKLDDATKKILCYIAIHRTLIKSDPATIRYFLLKLAYPEWFGDTTQEINEISRNIKGIKKEIEGYMNNKLSFRFKRLMRNYTPLFLVLRAVVADNLAGIDELLDNPASLQAEIEKKTVQEYKEVKSNLRRAAFRSIIYLFITKMALAVIIEVPVDLYWLKTVEWLPIGINVAFPPLLMLIVAVFTRVPGKKNTTRIIKGINSIVYLDRKETIIFNARSSYVRSTFLSLLFKFLYFITFIISFGAVGYVLYILHFNLASAFVFLMFLTLVSFFGFRVRDGAKEYLIPAKKDGVLRLIFDLYTLPILRAGRWISQEFSKINVFVFVFDFLIEAPFKMLIELGEQWLGFVREKREEII